MSAKDWQQLEPLLNEALNLPTEQRAAFLQQACHDDLSLRQEIEAMLAEEERLNSFLETPVLPLPDDLKAAPAPSLIGQQLGKYKIVSLLGKGGMGEVYLAHDPELDRQVAIKLLPPGIAHDSEQIARFKREARMLAKLDNHPNIAIIHDLELNAATPFLVLEYVPGETLAERMQAGRLSIAEALPLLQQIAAALVEAQQQGIIHRDLKPANIKIAPGERVKVLDFGLAKILHHDAVTSELADTAQQQLQTTRSYWTTARHVISGTVPYMSPEQTYGLPLDHRTDLWAFGCLCFEALTGRRPFQGTDTIDLFHTIRTQEPNWQLLPPELPHEVRHLLQECLRKEPEARLASAQVACERLATVSKRTPQVIAQLSRWKKHLVLTVTASLVLSLGAIYRQPLQTRWRTLFATTTTVPLIPKEKTLVILPFKEANQPTQEDKVGRGLAKTLQDVLSSITELRVLPFAEALQANLANAKPDTIAKTLGVNLVLTGEVQRTGEAITIRYWVQNKDGLPLLNGAATGKSGDYAKLQTDITAKVVNELKLSAAQIQSAVAFKTAEAAEKYLAALTLLQSDLTPESIEQTLQLLTELAQTEATAAPVFAALSQAQFQKAKLSKNADVATKAVGLALTHAEHAIELSSTSLEAELARGQALLFVGEKTAEARQTFVRVREKQPSNLEAILGIAYSYQDEGQQDKAEEYFRAAVSHWPDYWGSHHELGTFWLDQGQFEKALAEEKIVIELNRTGISGYVNAGNACIKLGRYAEAEDYFYQALGQRTNRTTTIEEAYIGWGTARYYQGLYAQAAESYQTGLTFNSESIPLTAYRGDALRQLPGQQQETTIAYERAISLLQKRQLGPLGLAHLAELWAKHSQLSNDETQQATEARKAEGIAQQALRQAASNATVLKRVALVYFIGGKEQQAFTYLAKAVQQGYSLADLKHDPDFQQMVFDPRFESIVVPAQKNN